MTTAVDYWYCWIEPLHTPKMCCQKGDMAKALAWFREKVGKQPAAVQFHPGCAFLADEVPKGISWKLVGGVSKWQIQVRDEETE